MSTSVQILRVIVSVLEGSDWCSVLSSIVTSFSSACKGFEFEANLLIAFESKEKFLDCILVRHCVAGVTFVISV